MFIAVDGIDGAGKTTLVSQLAVCLEKWDPLTTKEPTQNSIWGRRLRESAERGRLSKDKEIEYFHKDRLWHIDNVIEPALASGRIVISDRYVDSTLAFQASSPDQADVLYESFVQEIVVPDITLILTCPVEVGLDRISRNRGHLTQFEKLETLENARIIYESRTGENYCSIDSSGTIEHTFRQVLVSLLSRFPNLLPLGSCDSILKFEPDPDQEELKTAVGG